MTIRIIPRLDIKGPNLVKGIHLEGLRVLGKPWNFAYRYYQEGADELIYMDVVASLYGRNNLTEIVKKTAENIFIPLTVGGGIRTVEDIKTLLRAGADKVAINTAAIHNPDLIKEGAEIFGSQCIVSAIEAKYMNGRYEAMTDNGREKTSKDVFKWVQEVVNLGAGEILLTSVDRDGTGFGYDLELVRKITESVSVPVIAHGGCGKPEHITNIIKKSNADAICASTIFHYNYLENYVNSEEFKEEGNIEFIKQKTNSIVFMDDRITKMGINDVKKIVTEAGAECRK
ncbi:tRNA-dihydrouridine synthase [Candidatus Micrarchaeota archaeon]|nr:tRNA-dihydrouridine synthase [Candidatus Micrarchaeota archaeon]